LFERRPSDDDVKACTAWRVGGDAGGVALLVRRRRNARVSEAVRRRWELPSGDEGAASTGEVASPLAFGDRKRRILATELDAEVLSSGPDEDKLAATPGPADNGLCPLRPSFEYLLRRGSSTVTADCGSGACDSRLRLSSPRSTMFGAEVSSVLSAGEVGAVVRLVGDRGLESVEDGWVMTDSTVVVSWDVRSWEVRSWEVRS